MFDIGFTELLVIGVVALIVVGPERLPRVARTVGALLGRLQRYVADVKADINREVELEELRKMKDSVQQAASEFETSMNEDLRKAESDLNRSVAEAAGEPVAGPAPATPEATAALDKPDAPEAHGASR
ncbi:MAG: Sec-independent protein translocase protein TatB [Betaproteobacteria bacterium]|jgi:sec-independent protein translocase protein TatB|nr:Sec-independent protein translocase protein TatB [Betaproteobacteria bacterium]